MNVGDRVTAPGLPFWLTIARVQLCGRVECRFGSAGGFAGAFWPDELRVLDENMGRERVPADTATQCGDRVGSFVQGGAS